MSQKTPAYFISHGGGPWAWMPAFRARMQKLEKSLVDMVASWPEKPRAILMVSGHWEEDTVKIMSSPKPPMVYDYYGFPPETYEIQYPAPGAPDLAQTTLDLLTEAGIAAELDDAQGYDHGTFVPSYIMYPDADVPVYQISLLKSYDPEAHIKIGRALAPLREMGVVIIGSGLSYHNLRLMDERAAVPSREFDDWLWDVLEKAPEQRTADLINWEQAPSARVAHKEEDHLVPLFVALGAAEGDTATRVYHETDFLGHVTASSYRFD